MLKRQAIKTATQIKLLLDIAEEIREKLLSIPTSQQKEGYLFVKKIFLLSSLGSDFIRKYFF